MGRRLAAVVLSLALLCFGIPGASAASGDGCPDYYFLAVKGSGQAYLGEQNLDNSEVLKKLFMSFSTQLSGKTVEVKVVNYSAESTDVLAQDFGLGLRQFLESLEQGVYETRSAFVNISARCPSTPIAIAGYSQGAAGVHGFLNQATPAQMQQVSAVGLISDPLRMADSGITNFGTAPVGSYGACLTPVGVYVACITSFEPAPLAFSQKVWEVCDRGDIVCDTSTVFKRENTPAIDILIKRGVAIHTAYADGSAFELKKLGKRMGLTTAAMPLSIIQPTVGGAVVGDAYLLSLNAVGGEGARAWTADGLPSGLSIDAMGRISGTPVDAGVYQAIVAVRDTSGNAANLALKITVSGAPVSNEVQVFDLLVKNSAQTNDYQRFSLSSPALTNKQVNADGAIGWEYQIPYETSSCNINDCTAVPTYRLFVGSDGRNYPDDGSGATADQPPALGTSNSSLTDYNIAPLKVGVVMPSGVTPVQVVIWLAEVGVDGEYSTWHSTPYVGRVG